MATSGGNGKSKAETVEIDREAFQRLEQARIGDESLSAVIKRCVRPRRTAREILRIMRRASVSPATLRSIEASAERRRRRTYKSKG
jgi:predicted CopG family antitoxin